MQDLENNFPKQFSTYHEPFLGGGAVMFNLLTKKRQLFCNVSDFNSDLILAYVTIRDKLGKLIESLENHSKNYHKNSTEYYYEVRKQEPKQQIEKVSRLLFLNKTCFNGLFRVNSKGEFNVPIGSYKNPSFPSKQDLLEVQNALGKVTIHLGSFEECKEFIDEKTFVYFDPPYRPLSETSHFVSYTKGAFDDDDQKRLAAFVQEVNDAGAKFILSNSDPKNTVPDDEFFDDLYSGFKIDRILCNRAINSKASKRGAITELLIGNCW